MLATLRSWAGGQGRRLLLTASAVLTLLITPSLAEPPQPKTVPESRAQMQLSFAPLVKQVAPAVVNLMTERDSEEVGFSGLANDPFFKRFLGAPVDAQPNPEASLGSGVIVDPSGLIVTNHHVVDGARKIRVVLSDKREFDASIVRTDESTDLAVLSIFAPEPLPYLPFADTDSLEVGDLVLAIGNPFGVGQTVTSGIISAVARTNVGITDFNFFIQTDAAINPGNSGGALITTDGALAGVNTAIFSRVSGSQGIGFAVPADMVRTVIDSVGTTGVVRRPWFGAEGLDLTADSAANLGLDRPAGALISAVHPTGPASAAGIMPGDVIRAVDGRDVEDESALRFRLATGEIGSAVPVSLLRGGEEVEVILELSTAPEAPLRDVTRLHGEHPFSGATFVNLSPAVAEELGVSTLETGVMVIAVANGSPAAQVGLRALDVVVEVNEMPIDVVATLGQATERPQDVWRLSVRRDGRILKVSLAG